MRRVLNIRRSPAFISGSINPLPIFRTRRLLDRTLQWMFNKESGRYLQLVVSASRSLVKLDRKEILQIALAELAEFFPKAGISESRAFPRC